MTEQDDINNGKGFAGWAKDPPFLKVVGACIVLVALCMSAIGYSDGESWGTVIYMGFAVLVGGLAVFSAGFLVISCLIWVFQRRWVKVVVSPTVKFFFAPIAAAISTLFLAYVWVLERALKLISILFVVCLVLAVLAGIAGLLLFGIKQLF